MSAPKKFTLSATAAAFVPGSQFHQITAPTVAPTVALSDTKTISSVSAEINRVPAQTTDYVLPVTKSDACYRSFLRDKSNVLNKLGFAMKTVESDADPPTVNIKYTRPASVQKTTDLEYVTNGHGVKHIKSMSMDIADAKVSDICCKFCSDIDGCMSKEIRKFHSTLPDTPIAKMANNHMQIYKRIGISKLNTLLVCYDCSKRSYESLGNICNKERYTGSHFCWALKSVVCLDRIERFDDIKIIIENGSIRCEYKDISMPLIGHTIKDLAAKCGEDITVMAGVNSFYVPPSNDEKHVYPTLRDLKVAVESVENTSQMSSTEWNAFFIAKVCEMFKVDSKTFADDNLHWKKFTIQSNKYKTDKIIILDRDILKSKGTSAGNDHYCYGKNAMIHSCDSHGCQLCGFNSMNTVLQLVDYADRNIVISDIPADLFVIVKPYTRPARPKFINIDDFTVGMESIRDLGQIPLDEWYETVRGKLCEMFGFDNAVFNDNSFHRKILGNVSEQGILSTARIYDRALLHKCDLDCSYPDHYCTSRNYFTHDRYQCTTYGPCDLCSMDYRITIQVVERADQHIKSSYAGHKLFLLIKP